MDFSAACCLIAFQKNGRKSYSMVFIGNYLIKSSNILLVLEKEINVYKFSREFP